MAFDIPLLFQANYDNSRKEQENFKTTFLDNCDQDEEKENKKVKYKQIFIELHNTEVSYLLQLEIIIQFFIRPLSSNQILPKQAFDLLFGNILQLYNINKELLHAIKANPPDITTAFSTFAPYLKLYSMYAYDYKRALQILEDLQKKNKPLQELIRRQETRPEVGVTLISLLIAPIQRVPRYRLLLQSLLSHYHPSQPQYKTTQDALLKVEETAEHINRLITEGEEAEALVQLSRRLEPHGSTIVVPGRKILKQGPVRKTSKNGLLNQQRYLVLMTDALLLCKGGSKGSLSAGRLMPLHRVAVEPALGSAVFQIKFEENIYLLFTSSPDLGAEWIQDIQDAIRNHEQCRRTLRKDTSKQPLGQPRLASVSRTTAAILRRARQVCRGRIGSACVSKLKRLRHRPRHKKKTS